MLNLILGLCQTKHFISERKGNQCIRLFANYRFSNFKPELCINSNRQFFNNIFSNSVYF